MNRSHRAITSKGFLLFRALTILTICVIILAGLFWLQAKKTIDAQGASFIAKRMEAIINAQVSMSDAYLTFPNHLLLEQFTIIDKEGLDNTFASPRVEIDLSILSILTGTITPKKIRFMAPHISFASTQEAPLSTQLQNALPAKTGGTGGDKKSLAERLKPSSWPIQIDPTTIELIGCQAHIEDELDTMPTMDGRFNLFISRASGSTQLAPERIHLQISDIIFFYHGIDGTVKGEVEIGKLDSEAQLTFNLAKSGDMNFEATIHNYQDQAEASFELDSQSVDLKNFALIKYPLPSFAPKTNISGNISSSAPFLYGKPFDSFTASIIFNQGSWRVDALSLKLADNRGNIGGSIVPAPNDTDKSMAKAILTYEGEVLPDFTYGPELHQTFSPIFWKKPYKINTELTLDLQSYPLQSSEVKITGSHGDFFAKGNIDLFSGYTTLAGTYLKPVAPGKPQQSGLMQADALSLTLSGPLRKPNISESEIEPPMNINARQH